MFIETLVDFINLLKNQGQARYYNPEEIMQAFNRSQLDKFREDYKIFEETQEITDSLRPFKLDFEYNTPASINPLPTEYAHFVEFSVEIDGTEFPGKLVADELWNIRELSVLQKHFGDNIQPFKHSVEITLADGEGNLPGDYVDRIDVDAFTGNKFQSQVDITNEHQFVRRKNDRTYPPTEPYAIGWIGGHKITFAPDTITKVKLYYYRYPAPTRPIGMISVSDLLVKPLGTAAKIILRYLKLPVDSVYAYTVIDSRNLLFDEGNSTDTEYGPLEHSTLVLKTLQYLGIPLKDQYLLQFEQMKTDIKPE